MAKQRSVKFWIGFWTVSVVFLSGWYAFWEYKNRGIQGIVPILDMIPFFEGEGEDYKYAAKIAGSILNRDGKERTYLILFQNNLEIRPGGGFIGAFGIVKTKNGEVLSIETHDLSNFDNRIPDGIEPPYPMKETLRVNSWKMRDSNYSPDFEVNARKAEEFYYLGKGGEKFDGIIGVTTNLFSSILEVIGPVELADYPGKYDSQNAVITLEYQVEKAFEEQGISRINRKSVMTELAEEIQKKVYQLDESQKIDLGKHIINELNKGEIDLYFKDQEIQKAVLEAGWGGKVDQDWRKDYLMLVDANLGAFKSDYYMQRSVDYTVDMSGETPTVQLKITYKHTAKQKDWMTRDYISYLRVYVPEGSWLTTWDNFGPPKYGKELGKEYFGGFVRVPIGSEKTVVLNYTLPKGLDLDYDLMVQKQTGVSDVPYRITVIGKDGSKIEKEFRLNSEAVLSKAFSQ